MREIVKIGLAVCEGDRLLLVRKKGTTFFILPGGKPEVGESDVTALRREIVEELGCGLDPESIEPIGTFSDAAAGMPGTLVTVRLYRGTLIGTPQPMSEIDLLVWFGMDGSDADELAPSLRNSIIPFLTSRHGERRI